MWFCRKIFDCWVPTLSNICALGWIQAKYQPKAFLFDLRLSFSRICFPVFNLIRQGIWQAHFCIICHYYILTLATWPLSHKKSLWKDKYLKRIKDIQTHTKIQIISIQLKKKTSISFLKLQWWKPHRHANIRNVAWSIICCTDPRCNIVVRKCTIMCICSANMSTKVSTERPQISVFRHNFMITIDRTAKNKLSPLKFLKKNKQKKPTMIIMWFLINM